MLVNRKVSQIILWGLLFIALVITVIPLLWTVAGAFKTNFEILDDPFSLPKTLDFKNIIQAWQLGNFKTYFFNSAFITIFSMIIVILTACPAGYAFAQMKFKGNNIVFYLFILGLAIPVQAIIIPIFYQLKSMGMVNTLTGVTLVSSSLALPFSIFLMRNSFKDVPVELREAAYIDGASEWKTYFTVMLPLAKPAVVALLVFTFMHIWNDFLLPLVLLIDDSKYTIAVGLYSFQGEFASDYGIIFGGTLISMVPSIIVYLIFQRQFIEGMSSGANK
jgi:ABC-type glycerol-3-phosphate transport system permease component